MGGVWSRIFVELPGASERTEKVRRPDPRPPEAPLMPTTPVVGLTVSGPVLRIVAVPVIRSSCARSEMSRTDSANGAVAVFEGSLGVEALAPIEQVTANAEERQSAPVATRPTRSHPGPR